ncbi:MAG: hypothetical protein KBC06_02555 [Candidatus Pacebacteria bacterium]|nr:hypothetical protein [Candidatus Paceibacterota bacterium]
MNAMSETLESQIISIAELLEQAQKANLAKCIRENWAKTALAYSEELNTWEPSRGMEPELASAFTQELIRLDTPQAHIEQILTSMDKRRVLQTAPHLVATENPRMLCINWLGSLGVKSEEFYIVGMFSGIPFSNNFRPGRINFKHNPVNLFPSTMQDGLVYRSLIPEKMPETLASLPEKMREFLPKAVSGESYTKWALKVCQNIERKILGKENLVYLDINEVITNYLVQVLANQEHVFYKIFFDPQTRAEFSIAFPDETLFYMPVMMSKFETTRKVKMDDLLDAETLIKDLKDKRFCPALITGFLALAFLNEFKCFGSFSQVEYLPAYQEKLKELSWAKDLHMEKVPTANLTTGSFVDGMSGADIIMEGNFKPNPEILFGELLINIKDKLIK